MNEYLEANRAGWDELVPIHEKAVAYYDAEGFKFTKMSLHSIELEELGDVSGKSLLHLGCHFGQDTLSWATLGAKATGVDFSDKAIGRARYLSRELEIEADFVLSDIYGLPEILDEEYDIVFMSYGVLPSLPDVRQWARVISHFLRPEGIFYMAEFHPFSYIHYRGDDAVDWRVGSSYFHTVEPRKIEPSRDYADASAKTSSPTYRWTHSLGDILNSLVSAGLRIEFLNEFPYTIWRQFPFLEEDSDGWWRPKAGKDLIPLLYSIKAIKDV